MCRFVFIALSFMMTLSLSAELKTSLDGPWSFGIDPVDVGVEQGWFIPGLIDEKWDKVTVPHCYSVDPRYRFYTGRAWYFKNFQRSAIGEGDRSFIRFEAVFYRAQVWLNGKLLGEHEGGYTPFEFEVTDHLGDENMLAVRVNNAWDATTLPGSKTKVSYQSLNYGQLYPWMNYGGIIREVSLISRPSLYLKNVKIEAVPDLTLKTARLTLQVFIRNSSTQSWDGSGIGVTIYREGEKVPVEKLYIPVQQVAPDTEGLVRIEAAIPKEQVRLWSFDSPVLYEAEVTIGRDVARYAFGIRSIAVQGTKLLLNGEPISLGGCNRPLDAPGYGSMDPLEILEKDLKLMKCGGMELSRIIHYPVSTQLLNWADRNGLMIIAEAGNWQLTPKQMADPSIRAKFRSQMREMIERDWNHPCIIAWSMGNEYKAETEEGTSWTKDMCEFTKSLDSTRLVTFAGKPGAFSSTAKPNPAEYVDFISVNIYGTHLQHLRQIHALHPDKPIYVSEFGRRVDDAGSEKEQAAYFGRAMADFRECDFVIGASVWTFNDYASLFPGSNADGYRPWGLVSPTRSPRSAYFACQEEFAPAVLAVQAVKAGQVEVSVTARKDFPSYTLRNYRLRIGAQVLDVPDLAPGQRFKFTIEAGANGNENIIELVKPGGFVILKSTY